MKTKTVRAGRTASFLVLTLWIVLVVCGATAVGTATAGSAADLGALGAMELVAIVEGEDFVAEENGTVEKLNNRMESSGGWTFRNWDYADHALEWEVDIPETADYKIVVRYANGYELSGYRELLIDGQILHPAFSMVEFPPTGGWCRSENSWRNYTLRDADGNTILVHLAKGRHVIRMTVINVPEGKKGSTNIDCFGFLGEGVDPNILGVAGVP